MKILVFGGTGAMGKHLITILSDAGHKVFVTTRNEKKSSENILYLRGNALETDFLNVTLLEKWDVIVDFMLYSTNQFDNRIKKLLNSTNHYIFISSARVYSNCDTVTTENSKRLIDISTDKNYLSVNEYALNKAKQEDILINSGYKNWSIIRPYITYSEFRLQLGVFEKEEWLYRALKGRTIVFAQEMKDKITTMTYGYDVALGISKIIGKELSKTEIFQITTNKSIKWKEVIEIYQDVIENKKGFRPKVKFIQLQEFMIFRPENSKYQILYDRMFDRKFDNSKISDYIDVTQFTEIRNGIEICVDSFLENLNYNDINWKHEAIKDKITNEFANINEIRGIRNIVKYLINRII